MNHPVLAKLEAEKKAYYSMKLKLQKRQLELFGGAENDY